jgi:16S rRNA (uracil1498-N3)-methyltransferase
MHRFYLAPAECAGNVLLLKDREAHHAAHVLRLQPNEPVTVLDGVGTELDCTIQRVSRKEVALLVRDRRKTPRPAAEITLFQAIVKGKTMEIIVQKATELGVTRIMPLQTDRVVPHLDNESGCQKQQKWQITAIETIKQCGSRWLPQIDLPVTPAAFLKRTEKFDLALVASLAGDGRHARHWFEMVAKERSAAPRTVSVWIGPEGDFTGAELDLIRSAGAKPITLGSLVLRADTAAVYSLSIIRHELAWITATGSKS